MRSKNRIGKTAVIVLSIWILFCPSPIFAKSGFHAEVKSLPDWVIIKMKRHSWRESCPVPLKDLSYIYLKHWDYEGKIQNGRLVVHRKIANDVVQIFKALFESRFPIEKMKLIEDYKGSDDASMADNNTSAFNCRPVLGKPNVFSLHSYGVAIDINPLVNPYIYAKGKKVAPPEGKAYVDRTLKVKGMIKKGDMVYKAFLDRGWTWGGNWRTVKDYQHFQKKIKY